MGTVILNIKRLEPEFENKTLAVIACFKQGSTISYEVKSNNQIIKQHLELILNSPYYNVVSGPKLNQGTYAVHGEFQMPNTLQFFMFLPDRLAWYGYTTNFVNRKTITKSLLFDEDLFDDYDDIEYITKSISGNINDYTSTNKDGDLIVHKVPPGYVAMSSDGKVVGPGKYLNANVTKPDAKWRLVQDTQYQDMYKSGKSPQMARDLAMAHKGEKEYSPAMHPQIYTQDSYQVNPNSPLFVKFKAVFDKATPLEKVIEGLLEPSNKLNTEKPKGSSVLPTTTIAYSPTKKMLVPGKNFSEFAAQAGDWILFDARPYKDLTPEQIVLQRTNQYKTTGKINPIFIPNAFTAPQNIGNDSILDLATGVPYAVEELLQDKVTSTKVGAKKKVSDDFTDIEFSNEAVDVRRTDTSPEQQRKIQALLEKDVERRRNFFFRDEDGLIKPKERENLKSIQEIAPGPEVFMSSEGLRPYQEYGVQTLIDKSKYRVFGGPDEADGVFLNVGVGLGKELDVNEKILTPTGWTRNGDLKLGQEVIDRFGHPTKVTGIYPQGIKDSYLIEFSDGTNIEAGLEHQWIVQDYVLRKNNLNNNTDEFKVVTTKDLLENTYFTRKNGRKIVNYSLPIVKPVLFKEQETKLDAYLLGLILGDGDCNKLGDIRITVGKEETQLVTYLKNHEDVMSFNFSEKNNAYRFKFSRNGKIANAYKTYNLCGLLSYEKFIPEDYIFNSISVREAILQGLFDTDGYSSKGNGIEFSTTSERLAKNVQEIVRSLGGRASIRSRMGKYRKNNIVIETRINYRVQIVFPEGSSIKPFKLHRKLENFKYANPAYLRKYVKSVTLVDKKEMQCISVDAPDCSYVTKDYIVTHNTAVVLAAEAIMRNRGLFDRTTLIIAPNNLSYNWKSEIKNFRKEETIIIEGTPEQRKRQWEQLAVMAARGVSPKFVVLGVGKVRFNSETNEITDEEEYNPTEDLKYLKQLSQPFKVGGKVVDKGLFSLTVVDETSLFSNPESNRHYALRQIINWVTGDKNKGVVWTLNGNISSNSAVDTIVEAGWVNSFIRNNIKGIVDIYTDRVAPQSNRRVWKSSQALKQFMGKFRHSFLTITKVMAVGEDRRIKPDLYVDMGEEFYKVYAAAMDKLEALYAPMIEDEEDNPISKNWKVGLMMSLQQSSFGVGKPQRLLEYDLASTELLRQARERLSSQDVPRFDEQIRRYVRLTTDTNTGLGRMPKAGDYKTTDRDKLYEEIVEEGFRKLLYSIVNDEWHNPLMDNLMKNIDAALATRSVTTEALKLGVIGQSRMAVENIYRRLRKNYDFSKLRIGLIAGNMKPEETQQVVEEHNRKVGEGKYLPPVITLVTGAGSYGLNLSSQAAWRYTGWSGGKADQQSARFHRNPFMYSVITRLIPPGIGQYMSMVEDGKIKLAQGTEQAVTNLDDDIDEDKAVRALDPLLERSFIEHLRHFRPRVVKRNK